ncbi:hypothetical protein KR009_000249 [Drosophila setifemur]|nr:hypothetical protein KR009_000249 [Drosophila setifemur]
MFTMSHPSWITFIGIVFYLNLGESVRGEFYSSVDSMQDLAQVEQELLNATRSYLEAQQQQLDFYRRFVQQVKQEQEWAVAQVELDEYLGHPLHAFRLIKRLVHDWDHLIFGPLITNEPTEDYRQLVDGLTKDLGYPDQSELQGAIKGIARLQRVYNLTASDLADGVINDIFYDTELDWRGCFEFGVQLFDLGEYKTSLEWLQVAFVLLQGNQGAEHKDHYFSEIREYAALANFELGNPRRAGRLLNQILKPEPTNPAQQSRKYLESRDTAKNLPEVNPSWYANYTRLCRGKKLPEERSGDPLICYLDGRRNTYFTLAPLQVEQVHLDPDIHIYHNMLSFGQINSIFDEADKLEMIRSAVAGDGGKRTVRDLRVSQQTWLDYNTPVMKSIGRINQYVSGLDMAGAEFMQVANYGVGGQYEPHPDYFEFNLPKQFQGDRISTSMFYVSWVFFWFLFCYYLIYFLQLSDVEQGGYTVFTKLNIFLPPVRGALVMWHNLHRSLDVDSRTLHAGCPVIVGSKRIGNIWLHSGFQEFRRPCNLTSDSYKSLAYRDRVSV